MFAIAGGIILAFFGIVFIVSFLGALLNGPNPDE